MSRDGAIISITSLLGFSTLRLLCCDDRYHFVLPRTPALNGSLESVLRGAAKNPTDLPRRLLRPHAPCAHVAHACAPARRARRYASAGQTRSPSFASRSRATTSAASASDRVRSTSAKSITPFLMLSAANAPRYIIW